MDRIRRRRLSPAGPQAQRLHAGADPRRVLHDDGEGGVQQLQGFPAAAVPNPDEVPRRGATAGGHPARPRVRHEGLLLLRRRRRRVARAVPGAPRGVSTHLRHAGRRVRDRLCRVRGDGWQRVRGVPGRKRHRRGHVRALRRIRLCRQRRGGHDGRPGAAADRRPARGQGVRHPGHPDDRHARRVGQHSAGP